MPYDFQQFSITRLAAAQLTVPRWSIALQVTDSQTGALVKDFTGANAVVFPNVLGQLSNTEQDEMVAMIVNWLIQRRIG